MKMSKSVLVYTQHQAGKKSENIPNITNRNKHECSQPPVGEKTGGMSLSVEAAAALEALVGRVGGDLALLRSSLARDTQQVCPPHPQHPIPSHTLSSRQRRSAPGCGGWRRRRRC